MVVGKGGGGGWKASGRRSRDGIKKGGGRNEERKEGGSGAELGWGGVRWGGAGGKLSPPKSNSCLEKQECPCPVRREGGGRGADGCVGEGGVGGGDGRRLGWGE